MHTIYWIRRDFRLKDNLALQRAQALGLPVLPVYIYFTEQETPWTMGAASRWWLHHSLTKFEKDLKKIGLSLLILKGDPISILKKLIVELKASYLVFNRLYEPLFPPIEDKIIKMAADSSCLTECFSGDLLFEPGQVMNQQGKPYSVFTPFWRSALKEEVELPLQAVRGSILGATSSSKGGEVTDLNLLPKINWDKEFYSCWDPGEKGAWERLEKFEKKILSKYEHGRNFPFEDWTSRLSPHLHFGEITPRQIWHALIKNPNAQGYLREIGWREFARHLLFFFPKTPLHPLRKEFEEFPWKKNMSWLRFWREGKTGVPIVDAGMRQLWHTGWMHNRVRMIVGSFLVKDLMIPWQDGAKWFWDTLLDADLANNTLGWQWVGGCGADAAPYFRIFNPVAQGEKFDPEGEYVRRFVPELKKMPASWIHKPHLAPAEVLCRANVALGVDYPFPIIDHDVARKRALEQYARFTKAHKR